MFVVESTTNTTLTERTQIISSFCSVFHHAQNIENEKQRYSRTNNNKNSSQAVHFYRINIYVFLINSVDFSSTFRFYLYSAVYLRFMLNLLIQVYILTEFIGVPVFSSKSTLLFKKIRCTLMLHCYLFDFRWTLVIHLDQFKSMNFK